jgi:hypothetical protein
MRPSVSYPGSFGRVAVGGFSHNGGGARTIISERGHACTFFYLATAADFSHD